MWQRIQIKNLRNKAGISLLELLLSLAIIAILLVAATRYYESTRSAETVNEAMKMLQDTTGAADNWYATFKSFTGTPNGDISITALVTMNLVPNDFNSPGANPWGGSIAISAVDDQHVQIKLANVPAADCLNLQEIMKQHNINGTCSGTDYIMTYP